MNCGEWREDMIDSKLCITVKSSYLSPKIKYIHLVFHIFTDAVLVKG